MIKTLKIGLIFIIFIACNRSTDILYILSDKTELAIATEMFAVANEDVRVIFRHIPSIDSGTVTKLGPDLVIGDDINSTAMTALLSPMEFTAEIYPSLTGPKDARGREMLIPLAFKLPVIMGRREEMEQLPDQIVVRERDMRAIEADFMKRNDSGRLTRLGFAPSWNPLSYIDLLWLNFRIAGGQLENMNDYDSVFGDVRDALFDWMSVSGENIELVKEFDRQYRYIPDEVLLTQNRIRFARVDFNYWISIPDIAKQNLDIRYFSGDRTIPIQSVTWGGISRNNTAGGSAEAFMKWLLEPETQKSLIDRWAQEGLTVFGFFDGLSSIPTINQTAIIDKFPSVSGMIPENHFLTMQETLPDRWFRIREEVVIPWFESAIFDQEKALPLSESYTKWEISSLEQSD